MNSSKKLFIENLNKTFEVDGRTISVLKDINLTIEPGEFVSIVGTSGCGKTTLLRLIVGLDSVYEGNILFNGERIHGPGLNRGIVFQDHRLLPWLKVLENVGFGLDPKINKKEHRKIIQEYIDLVGLKGFEKSYPYQLSGGMAQRAAIARSLVNCPELLALDEPLGALDAMTRMYMQQELEKIWEKEKITMIMVTHDIEEAIYLSTKIVVMSSRPGEIKQIISIPLARPRDRASYEFSKIKEELLAEFNLQAEKYFSYTI
jgi:ABC-type nitrate/sulfonate/bicarbonate transport system, ATPase component